MKKLWRTSLLAVLVLCSPPPAAMADPALERVAERGPATLVIGASFVVLSLVNLPIGTLIGGDPSLDACRLGHGAMMTAAGVVLLPAGLLAAPFHPAGAATGFADSFAEAFQEDTCSRPYSSVLP